MQRLNQIIAVADTYQAFLFDIWGVVHDGKALYPGVADSFKDLRGRGKKVCLLSNSPRINASAAKNLADKFGLKPDMYDHLLTSGQATFEAVRDKKEEWAQQLGKNVYLIGPDHHFTPYKELGFARVKTIEEADFVLASDTDVDETSLAPYESVLAAALKKKLPLVCCNPDLGTIYGDTPVIAIGGVAERYAQLGGEAHNRFGKPHRFVFERALKEANCKPNEAVMIGDNPDTDIAGARGAGIATALMLSGMARPHLGVNWGIWPSEVAVATYLGARPQPDYAMVRLA